MDAEVIEKSFEALEIGEVVAQVRAQRSGFRSKAT